MVNEDTHNDDENDGDDDDNDDDIETLFEGETLELVLPTDARQVGGRSSFARSV
jgi:hypothetical protein